MIKTITLSKMKILVTTIINLESNNDDITYNIPHTPSEIPINETPIRIKVLNYN